MSEFRYFAYTDFGLQSNQLQQNISSLPSNTFKTTKQPPDDLGFTHELNVPYTVFEILVAVFAIIGNLMVIIVFQRERKLRRRTNYYIVSLAMADFLVGSLGVPFAILASIGLPTNLYACLFTVSLLIVLCTISIFCLVAVSVDRYWAILYPMAYSRTVRTKTAIVIISMCWLAGSVVGFLPLFGWHSDIPKNKVCLFTEVMDYNYLVFLYFATIITPALLMLAFYVHIYRVIVKQVRQIVTMNPVTDCSRRSSTAQIQTNMASTARSCHGGTMLRVLGASRKREVKATQNLSIIVLFFMICWFPLYTINCIQAFCETCEIPPKLTLFCIILSHLNSAVNPVLYAYHLRDFRAALKNLILRIMGVEAEPTVDPVHRLSMASQHRLQSLDTSMRNTVQPRIYIDSPIWLRQQESLKQTKYGVITPCLNNLNQSVIASVTPDVKRKMWNICEVSNDAEVGEVNYVFPGEEIIDEFGNSDCDDNLPTPTSYSHGRSLSISMQVKDKEERFDDPYTYDNHNYFTIADNLMDNTDSINAISPAENVNNADIDEVFLPKSLLMNGNKKHKKFNSTAEILREKLRSDDTDYLTHLHSSENVLSNSSYSNCNPSHGCVFPHTINASSSSPKLLISTELQATRPYSQSACEVDTTSVYVIEYDNIMNTIAHSSRFKTDKHMSINTRRSILDRPIRRSCSCRNGSHSLSSGTLLTSPFKAKKTFPSNAVISTHSTWNSSVKFNITAHLSTTTSSCSTLDMHNNNGNSSSYTTSNLNFFTLQQQQHHRHHNATLKHSSLFQIFQPHSTVTKAIKPEQEIMTTASKQNIFHVEQLHSGEKRNCITMKGVTTTPESNEHHQKSDLVTVSLSAVDS